ncbi:MAG: hypothetical protein CM1200mP18_04550 [Gammaproteobacteria bacterium]|nr:MAG: hypothetical protein CM1200mP18_04550 [Gammaproteobacteria bacterium]
MIKIGSTTYDRQRTKDRRPTGSKLSKFSTDDQRVVYRQWGDSYDQELIEEFGYSHLRRREKPFPQGSPTVQPCSGYGVWDGAGGEALDQAGYDPIDGLTYRPKCSKKRVH